MKKDEFSSAEAIKMCRLNEVRNELTEWVGLRVTEIRLRRSARSDWLFRQQRDGWSQDVWSWSLKASVCFCRTGCIGQRTCEMNDG